MHYIFVWYVYITKQSKITSVEIVVRETKLRESLCLKKVIKKLISHCNVLLLTNGGDYIEIIITASRPRERAD